jgi:hypothetical protein
MKITEAQLKIDGFDFDGLRFKRNNITVQKSWLTEVFWGAYHENDSSLYPIKTIQDLNEFCIKYEKKAYDFINPDHYKSSTKEVWEMMLEIWGKEKFIAHCEMCSFKYRMRLGLKPEQSVERDLEKAQWYDKKANELKRKK